MNVPTSLFHVSDTCPVCAVDVQARALLFDKAGGAFKRAQRWREFARSPFLAPTPMWICAA
ncbi:MAG: hypothetical protein ABJB02_02010 [Dokdonella sp.]